MRNVECTGKPHSIHLPCGWRGERFPPVQTVHAAPLPDGRWRLTSEFVQAVSKKPCPKCGGVVLPITGDGLAWPDEEVPLVPGRP